MKRPFFLRVFTQRARRLWIVVLLLLVLFLVLLSPAIQKMPKLVWVERPAALVMAALQAGLDGFSGGLSGPWDRYVALIGTQAENRRLAGEVERLWMDRIALQEEREAAARLRKLLGIRETLPIPSVAARVIGRDPTNWYRMAVLDKGEADGVAANRGVIAGDGVVGRVIKTAPGASRVLLLSDRSSAVAVLVQRSRVSGILEGQEDGRLILQYVPLEADVVPGDLILTSGLEGVFPKGLPVGRVIRVDRKGSPLFLQVQVVPFVDLSRLEEVLVLARTEGPAGWEGFGTEGEP